MANETVIILAGGRGTRLAVEVPDRPKPMALVNGRPFLEYLFDDLVNQGFAGRVVLSVGYMGAQIIDHFKDSFQGIPIRYCVEEAPLGTGGAIKKSIVDFDLKGPVFVKNGDTYSDPQLGEMLSTFKNHSAQICVSSMKVDDTSRFGSLRLEATHNSRYPTVMCFSEKSSSNSAQYINTGTYIVGSQILKDMTSDFFSFETDVLERSAADGNVAAFLSGTKFIDIGVPDDYNFAGNLFHNS